MNVRKRGLALLMCICMIFTLLPFSAFADAEKPYTEHSEINGVVMDKTVTHVSDDTYKVMLEQYVKGSVTPGQKTPIDVVLVLDVSGSMDKGFSSTSYEQTFDTSDHSYYSAYYVMNSDGSYTEVTWCDECSTFTTGCSWNLTWDGWVHTKGTKYTPKNSAEDASTDAVQFYVQQTNSTKKIAALKSAVNSFIEIIAKDNPTSKIAIVKFAGEKSKDIGNNTYSRGGYTHNYTQIVQNLTEANTDGAASLKAAVNALTANGATAADYGLEKAIEVFGAENTVPKDRNRVVIMFTDGEPNHGNGFSKNVANDAIKNAQTLKSESYGASVYTIGIFSGAQVGTSLPNGSTDSNRYMHLVSSNYPEASSMKDTGTGDVTKGFYKVASDASTLGNVFTQLGEAIGTPSIDLGSTAVLTDNIASNFKAPANTTDVKVYTADYNGNSKTFDDKIPFTGANVSINNNAVTVSGFNYSANFVSDTAHPGMPDNYGNKLIVEFEITVDRTKTYGGTQPANAGANITLEGKEIASVENPQVPVSIVNGFSASYKNSKPYDGNGFTIKDEFEAMLKKDNIADGEKNDYVNITYTVIDEKGGIVGTYVIEANKTTGTWTAGTAAATTSPDVGTYNYNVTCVVSDATPNGAEQVSKSGTMTLSITANEGLTVSGKDYKDKYDGASHGEAATASVDGATIEYSTDGGNTWTTTFPTVTNVSDSTEVQVRATKTGYVPAKATYNLIVTPRTITLTGESAARTYTGKEIELTGITPDGLLDGHNLSGVSYSAKGTDARTEPYPGTFSNTENIVIKDAAGKNVTNNYNVEYKPGALTINPIGTVTVTIKGNHDSKVYNGAEQSVEGYTVVSISDINYKDTDFSLKVGVEAKATGTNASDTAYPMGLTADSFVNNNKNFKNVTFVVEEDGSLTITKRPLTIEGQSSEPITYDGQTHSFMDWWPVTATDNTGLVSGHEVSGISYLLTGKDADSYTGEFTGTAKVMAGEVDVTGNYDIEYALGEMLIEPAEKIVIKITGNTATETYDGTEKSVTGYTADVKDSSITVKLKEGKAATAKGTDVGKYMMGLEAEDFVVSSTNNYKEIAIVVEDGYLDITPITDKVVVTITGHKDEFTYDGKEHTVNGYDTNISNQLYKATDFTFTGKAEVSRTEVGTSDMGLKNDQFQNVSKNFTNVKFVINDGGITIKERPYRPNPSITDKITVEITGNSDSVVYDGTEHSVKDYTVKISDSRYTEKDFTFSGKALASGINAGAYEMGLKADQFKNTNARFKNVEFIIKADGVLTITQRPLTITAGSAEGIAPVTCDKYTVEGLATGDKVDSVKLTGIQSEPGESPNVASDAVIKNAKGEDVTANYKITYVNGVLKAIEVLNKEIHFNYVIGYTDGTIRPNNDISRAEVATIFFRLLTDEAREQYTTTAGNFTDVKAGMWCNRAIATLTNMGIIKGYTDGSFQPNKSITRAELATIIARFAKLDVNTKTFSDINGHWAQKNIELAAGNGWINGYEDGTFRPNNNITRAETFAMINRVLDRQTESVSDLLPTSEMNMWSDNLNENAWYYKDVQEATNYHKCDRVGDSVYEKWTEKVPDIDWASYQI